MDEVKQAAWSAAARTLLPRLERRGMEGYYCATRQEAVEKVLELVEPGASVTWGGSVTFAQSGVKDALVSAGKYEIIDRAAASTPAEQRAMYGRMAMADYFFMSTNAITADGELVNIDGNGNRLACLIHGPRHVIVLAGMNKLTADVDSALKRIRTVSCPMNAARLHPNTPCEATGMCGDCHGPGCMCCQEVVTRHSRHPGRIKVILIGEELGF